MIISLIYVVEDDENISELILATLGTSGYDSEGFLDYEALKKGLGENIPQLIILDIMLPGKSGLEIIAELKENQATKDIPVIFLTAKGSELDKVKGLELGAEDYMTKPFGVLELLARVKTVLRRGQKTQETPKTQQTQVGPDLIIDCQSKEVRVHQEKIKLTFKEFELLEHLYKNSGIVLSRESLLNQVWGYDYESDTTRTVDMHIKSIRQKLSDSVENPKYIETVRGYGYKFMKQSI